MLLHGTENLKSAFCEDEEIGLWCCIRDEKHDSMQQVWRHLQVNTNIHRAGNVSCLICVSIAP